MHVKLLYGIFSLCAGGVVVVALVDETAVQVVVVVVVVVMVVMVEGGTNNTAEEEVMTGGTNLFTIILTVMNILNYKAEQSLLFFELDIYIKVLSCAFDLLTI